MRLTRGLLGERRSVAALEFGLVAPVMLTLLLGGWDIGRAILVWEQVFSTAQAVVEAAEKASAQPDGSFVLSATTAQTAMTSIYAQMPQLPTEGSGSYTYLGPYSVTLSSIVQEPRGCSIPPNLPGCSAYPAWSVVLQEGRSGQILNGAIWRRACGTVLTPVANFPNNATTLKTIPLSAITLKSPLLIADIQYQFTPMFFGFLTGSVTFWASAAFPVPGGNITTDWVQYSSALQNDPNVCTGYPY